MSTRPQAMVAPPPQPPLAGTWDVVVVGGGAAGLMAALELPAGLRVLQISKGASAGPRSASRWAQGGIAAVVRPEDSFASHIADTLRAGAGLCDPEAVALLVHRAPACVERLLELGMAFDRQGDGLSTTLEAAHSHRRVLHAQDRTGRALVEVLEARVQQRPGLEQRQGVLALGLWIEAQRCLGLQVLEQGRVQWLRCGAVVLASGGGGHLFANTTNPPQASGDGVAMAWRAGGLIRDLEFVQFHPTALMLPGAPHFLISEAVRGEGARLLDGRGESPVAELAGGDLAPRDQVSRALVRRMEEQGEEQLWLDLRPVGRQRLEQQFPTILGRCRELGLEPCDAPIPVAPAAHYWMGGIATDALAATTIPGLYAIGEVASTGVHGANRLASNSLMECLVYARQLAQLQPAPAPEQAGGPPREQRLGGDGLREEEARLAELMPERIRALRRRCWTLAGVVRDGPALRRALAPLRAERQELENQRLLAAARGIEPGDSLLLDAPQARLLARLQDLHQRLQLAELLAEAAAFREESRGGHFRRDAPASQPFWQRHTLQLRDQSPRTGAIGAALADQKPAGPR